MPGCAPSQGGRRTHVPGRTRLSESVSTPPRCQSNVNSARKLARCRQGPNPLRNGRRQRRLENRFGGCAAAHCKLPVGADIRLPTMHRENAKQDERALGFRKRGCCRFVLEDTSVRRRDIGIQIPSGIRHSSTKLPPRHPTSPRRRRLETCFRKFRILESCPQALTRFTLPHLRSRTVYRFLASASPRT